MFPLPAISCWRRAFRCWPRKWGAVRVGRFFFRSSMAGLKSGNSTSRSNGYEEGENMSLSLSEISSGLSKDKDENQLVVFTLAGCELAVGIRQVREIIRVSQVTMMPKAPKFLEGI